MKRILKTIGLVILYSAAYLVAVIITGVILVGFFTVKLLMQSREKMDGIQFSQAIIAEISQNVSLITVAAGVFTLLILLIIFAIRKQKLFKNCGFNKINMKVIGLSIAAGLGLNITLNYILSYLSKLSSLKGLFDSYEKLASGIMYGNALMTLICVGIIVPIFEEIFFRGVIYNELRKSMPLWIAIILQAVIFGVFHGNVIQGTYAFALALVFGLVYTKFKSIWTAIIIHMVINSSSVLLSKFIDTTSSYQIEIGILLIGIILTIVSLFGFWKMKNVSTVVNNMESQIGYYNNI